ncbi:DEAD/DEAH box helicase family protein [Psychromonas antarctica]|nr:DEAD/DEAH box helicase family protein [Psychromonas antarctica]MCG6202418.1 DEAD/DEAH box helicase family protein [Psychromonas antarctica]
MADSNLSLRIEAKQLTIGGDDPLLPKLIHAINRATEIEIAVSFIQRSGLNLLFEPLKDALINGASLQLLTSDYLDITDPIALRELMPLVERGADIRIYQSDNKQAFHMKSYIFVKTDANEIVDGCAFIGSNNISKSALTIAHEWNFRHDYQLPKTSREALEFNHIRSAFIDIFNHLLVQKLDNEWIDSYLKRRKKMQFVSVASGEIDNEIVEKITPNNIQIEALNALQVTREEGFKRGLVVLATGMGKTWLSAFDALQTKAKCILFVAHRVEILLQAQRTFAQLLPEKSTGFYNSENKDKQVDILFASVQTLGRESHLKQFQKEHFDYIVVDEFHHASAPVYKNLLDYFESSFLLGLTATPERTDQTDILGLCDNNLVYERNLTQGIDDKLLVPFKYYGIWDESVNYQAIPWRNGRFDPQAIDNEFITKKRADHVLKNWQQKKQQTTLAFCISTKHADYMAKQFNKAGIPALSVHANSKIRRNEALTQLQDGAIEVLFSVDLFNEGTDLPAIDTILMLRPSDSKILFLQQLGRGLRLYENKSHLVVLDFIGNHHSFLNKPFALFGGSSVRELVTKVTDPKLAAGCSINYDIEITQFWEQLAKQQRTTAAEDYQSLYQQLGHPPTASEFWSEYQDLKKVNKQHHSWMELVAEQQQDPDFSALIAKHGEFLLGAVQTTTMTKSFKIILLESFLRLDGFANPPTLEALASDSKLVFDRYPLLKQNDLSLEKQELAPTSKNWLKYWKDFPIKYSCTADKKTGKQWFTIVDGKLTANIDVQAHEKEVLHDAVQELIALCLLRYSQRPNKVKAKQAVTQPETNNLLKLPETEQLVFYPNLKIACGHFKAGDDSECEYQDAPAGFGHLQTDNHFLAKASGNSMNGGKNPVQDGDLLLLEWITPTSAGSLQGLTVAIEMQDEAGDAQYLLRVVKKDADNRYQLIANNRDYKTIYADENMKTFARLKGVVG